MIRRIIQIEESKCNGCGACAKACHEGAIGMVNGKAKLLRDDYCDGLGDCLPACPTGAITFVEREAAAYDEAAVQAHQQQKAQTLPCGCPGTHAKRLHPKETACACSHEASGQPSALQQWPVQIRLVPVNAPYFDQADLLIAADCTAYAYASMHQDFIRGRITLVGCPKLDDADYAGKLTEILRSNAVQSVTVVRMEVPCCGGLEHAARTAVESTGNAIPLRVVTISTDGRILPA